MTARGLWPREHGAYVQLAAPLAVALALAPSLAGGLLAVGAAAAFVAHEPLLVLRGRRGRRAQADHQAAARRALALRAATAVGVGAAGLALAPGALPVAVAVSLAAALAYALSWRGQAHSLGGELVAAAAFAGAAAPVGVAGGLAAGSALHHWLMWSLAFASTIVAVHVVIASHRRRTSARRWLWWIGLLVASGAGLAITARGAPAAAAAAPLWLVATTIAVVRPAATRLRQLGVVLACTAALTAGLVIAAHGVLG